MDGSGSGEVVDLLDVETEFLRHRLPIAADRKWLVQHPAQVPNGLQQTNRVGVLFKVEEKSGNNRLKKLVSRFSGGHLTGMSFWRKKGQICTKITVPYAF